MDPALLAVMVFGTVYIIINLLVGCYLINRYRKTKLSNIIWLSLYFIFSFIEFAVRMAVIITPITGLTAMEVVYFIINLTGHFFLIIFVKNTFYKERKSPFIIIICSAIIIKVIYIIAKIILEVEVSIVLNLISKGCASFLIIISSLWLAYASLTAYREFKKGDTEPWIRMRYLLIGCSAIILAAQSVFTFLVPYPSTFSEPTTFFLHLFNVLFNNIFAILSLIGWVMPQKLKDYYNRNYKEETTEPLSEKDLMDVLKKELEKGGSHGSH